jgi:predicted dehydrogenase
MKNVKVCVIGAGGISNSVHLPSLRDIDGINLAAICDVIPEKARKLAEKFAISETYTNYHEMLVNEKPDCVFVLVQPDQIFRIAMDCMNAGTDVFIEKPAGITLFQSESLVRASKDAGRILQVGMNRRYIPLIQAVVKRMREMTTITQIEGCFVKHGDAAFYNGCASAFVCDTIHAIDILSWIANSEPANAATVISCVNSPVENAWNSVIRFENGIQAVLKANYQTGGRVHTFELHGPNASAYINIGFGGEACEATILHCTGIGTFSLSAAGSGDFVIEKFDGKEIAKSDKYYRYYGYYDEDVAFIGSVRTGEKPLSDITASLRSMRLAEYILTHRI